MSKIDVNYFNGSDEILTVEYEPACADYKQFLIYKDELYYILTGQFGRVVMRDEDQVDFKEKEVDFQYLGDQLIQKYPEFFNHQLVRLYSSDEDYDGRMMYINLDRVLCYGYRNGEDLVKTKEESDGGYIVWKGDDIYYNKHILKLSSSEMELFIKIALGK